MLPRTGALLPKASSAAGRQRQQRACDLRARWLLPAELGKGAPPAQELFLHPTAPLQASELSRVISHSNGSDLNACGRVRLVLLQDEASTVTQPGVKDCMNLQEAVGKGTRVYFYYVRIEALENWH